VSIALQVVAVLGAVLGYTVIGGAVSAVARHLGVDRGNAACAGMFWPLTPVAGALFAVVCAVAYPIWLLVCLGDGVCVWVYRRLSRPKLPRATARTP
jgi:hypothetical protein